MKNQIKDSMRFGKVEFDIQWEFEFPVDLKSKENEALAKTITAAFETVKTTLAGKAKKGYAKALDKKLTDFSTDMVDDPEEAEIHWTAAVSGSEYKVSNFRPWVSTTASKVDVAKVLAWLQSLPGKESVESIIEGMDAAALKEAIEAA